MVVSGSRGLGGKRAAGSPKYKLNRIPTKTSEIKVYASPRVSAALRELTKDMTLYEGVRLSEILEAVYSQGMKDGARSVFAALEGGIAEIKGVIPHRLPGRPKGPSRGTPRRKKP